MLPGGSRITCMIEDMLPELNLYYNTPEYIFCTTSYNGRWGSRYLDNLDRHLSDVWNNPEKKMRPISTMNQRPGECPVTNSAVSGRHDYRYYQYRYQLGRERKRQQQDNWSIDQQKVYDSVDRGLAWEVLPRFRVPENITEVVIVANSTNGCVSSCARTMGSKLSTR